MYAPVSPTLDETLDWPKQDDVINSQQKATERPPKQSETSNGLIINDKGQTWIPSSDNRLKLRILIAAHTGQGGHRSSHVTQSAVESHFWWKGMNSDVKVFVNSCIHCLSTSPAKLVPRPLGHALHAVKPNMLLHFDYCYMSKGENGFEYVLIMKDDHSSYVWLTPTKETTAEVTAEVLIKWFASFGVVNHWVSDRGTHFKNELVRIIREETNSSHHFTLAYCPWSNGTVEVVCREMLRATRALLSEFQLPHNAWPSILPVVQSALNNTILKRLANRCPLTAFTGLPQDTPLSSIIRKSNEIVKVHSVDIVKATRIANLKTLHSSLESMHKEVAEAASRKRESAVSSHFRKTNVQTVNFIEGDYVLRGLLPREKTRKPSLKWIGPYRVIECRSNYLFVIEDLISKQRTEVHGRRLKLFRNKSYNVTEDVMDHLKYQQGELLVIDSFQGIRSKNSDIEILVRWRGFPISESDWVSVKTLKEDVPELLEDFIKDLSANGTQKERSLISSI